MSKKKDKQTTASRDKGTKSVKVDTRRAPQSPASLKSQGKTAPCSKLVEKAGFLVYTGPVHGDLANALDEQREARSGQLEGR